MTTSGVNVLSMCAEDKPLLPVRSRKSEAPHCWVVLPRDPERMADILDFACAQERGVVACARGTHRSVKAGQILELFPQTRGRYWYSVPRHETLQQ